MILQKFKTIAVAWSVAVVVFIGLTAQTQALEVVAIEEHWELKVGQPDGGVSGPQVTMIMSPTNDIDHDFFVYTLNYRSDPDFTAGGMQVQRWYGEDFEDSRNGSPNGMLHYTDETVTWVQRLELDTANNSLTFDVNNGTSESWGAFGNQGYMRFTINSTLANLNNYRPAVSITGSGVNFGGNRVKSLILTKIRWWDAEGNMYEMEAPIDVDADIDP
ncbi:MAG: hypothetical protein RH917_04490 [Lacipirellulaceae bacterium]